MTKMRVKDVMTAKVVTVTEVTPFRQVAALLYARGVGAVPVLDPAGRICGVVSNADLACKTAGPFAAARPLLGGARRRERRKAEARTAGEVMTAPAVTITPEATLGQAARAMRRHRIGRLPVAYPLTGRLAGIVTRSDLLRVYLRPDEDIRAEIETGLLALAGSEGASQLAAAVCGGVVTLSGWAERRSTAARLARAVQCVDGVVWVDSRLRYAVDDNFPITPASW